MNIAGLCQTVIVTVNSEASLQEAALLMREKHVGALVITDDAEPPRVVGVVTDRDLAIEVLARQLDTAGTRIGELASDSLVSVPGTASILEAVAAMDEDGVRRLLVTAEDGRVVGFVSADDLIDGISAELEGLARALRSGIDREAAERAAIAEPEPAPVFLPLGTPGFH